MGKLHWAPWLFMLVADAFPGSCCGGSRFRDEGLTVVNHTGEKICKMEVKDPASGYSSGWSPGIEPGQSELWHQHVDAGFVLRVFSCDGRELLVLRGKELLDPYGKPITTLDVRGSGGPSPPAPTGSFATPP